MTDESMTDDRKSSTGHRSSVISDRSQTWVRELLQRQADRLLVARASGDGLGELHVADAHVEKGACVTPDARRRVGAR